MNAVAGTPIRTHLAVIDVGTNAIRLQVARVRVDGAYQVLFDDREPVRLGEAVFRTGRLASETSGQAVAVIKRFVDLARGLGAGHFRAVATSAIRDADNGEDFIQTLEQETGLHLQVISGAREAELIARGILPALRRRAGPFALVDVGGGSTEVSLVRGGRLGFSASMQLGSARLTYRFCQNEPLSPGDEARLRAYIQGELRQQVGRRSPCPTVVGSAGTVGALGSLIRKRRSGPRPRNEARVVFSVEELVQASAAIRKMGIAERQRTPGIEERRSETIVAGAMVLEEICNHFGARTIEVVRRGLRDGLMLDEVEKLCAAKSQELRRMPRGRQPKP